MQQYITIFSTQSYPDGYSINTVGLTRYGIQWRSTLYLNFFVGEDIAFFLNKAAGVSASLSVLFFILIVVFVVIEAKKYVEYRKFMNQYQKMVEL